ncbi:hypothetical protein BLAT2472_20850 [Burkholderia latens]
MQRDALRCARAAGERATCLPRRAVRARTALQRHGDCVHNKPLSYVEMKRDEATYRWSAVANGQRVRCRRSALARGLRRRGRRAERQRPRAAAGQNSRSRSLRRQVVRIRAL